MADYEIFHDESMENGYWHGIFLVPVSTKQELINKLDQAREGFNYQQPLSFKNVKEKGRVFNIANSWIQIGVGFLRSKLGKTPYSIPIGRKDGRYDLEQLPPTAIGCKLIIFRERDNHQIMSGYPDNASKIETTFRFGLKGGIHFLGSEENPINITKIHFDGHEHHLRHLDQCRIVNRLYGLRNYCSISTEQNLIDDRPSDHRKQIAQDYEDCQLLQLTDLFIGGFRTAFGTVKQEIHKELAHPLNGLIKDYQKGYARMRNSRWCQSFWISECHLGKDGWEFTEIEILENPNHIQLSLGL